MDIVSTKKTNAIASNVTRTASINPYNKKVRGCYIVHTVLLVIILLLIITIICYHYAKQYKMENNEFKNVHIKNRTCYYFDDTIRLEDFDFDVLIDKKSLENILIFDISYKTLIDPNPLRIRFNKIDGFIRT